MTPEWMSQCAGAPPRGSQIRAKRRIAGGSGGRSPQGMSDPARAARAELKINRAAEAARTARSLRGESERMAGHRPVSGKAYYLPYGAIEILQPRSLHAGGSQLFGNRLSFPCINQSDGWRSSSNVAKRSFSNEFKYCLAIIG